MMIIALILFLISVISIGVYFFSRPAESDVEGGETEQVEFIDQGKQLPADTSQQPPAAQQETPAPVPEQSSAEQTPPPPPPGVAPKASIATSGKTAASGGVVREQPTRKSVPSPDIAESRVPRAEPEPEPAPKPAPKPKPEPAPKPAPKPKPEVAPQAPSKESVREQAPLRNVVPAPSASLKTTKSASSAGAQWVVQVHSSASVDDADEWLRQLQSRNVGDGRIEPVTQQGKVWYRVRFGRYATREEAEQAALQLGYRNAWIDRVR
jgi:septal ring-binding cell division protein DamX